MILVHGGPGFPEMRLFRYFNAQLEKSFTVVYWEQRGTGKSFDSRIAASSMTVQQFIADLDELVNAVRKRFGKDKVAIYGHSWGSALGVLYAARFPYKVSAHVGAAQVGDWPAIEAICYDFTLAEAERRGNRKALGDSRRRSAAAHRPESDRAAQMAHAICRHGARYVVVDVGGHQKTSFFGHRPGALLLPGRAWGGCSRVRFRAAAEIGYSHV
jgi:pimeloyl-ACP methyl ester carboxylesterase